MQNSAILVTILWASVVFPALPVALAGTESVGAVFSLASQGVTLRREQFIDDVNSDKQVILYFLGERHRYEMPRDSLIAIDRLLGEAEGATGPFMPRTHDFFVSTGGDDGFLFMLAEDGLAWIARARRAHTTVVWMSRNHYFDRDDIRKLLGGIFDLVRNSS